jgi:hypothetical protein
VATNRHCSLGKAELKIGLRNAVVFVLLSSVVVGCAGHQVPQTAPVQMVVVPCPKAETNSTELQQRSSSTTEPTDAHGCPTINDVRAKIVSSRKLIDEANKVVIDLNRVTAASSSAALDAEITRNSREARVTSLRKRAKEWTEDNRALMKGCDLLYSAHGEMIHPEFFLALENLNYAGEWLEQSMNAAASGKQKLAQAYIKGAHLAKIRASKVLEGKAKANSRTAVIKTPGFLKKLIKES